MTEEIRIENHEFVLEVENLLEENHVPYIKIENCFVIDRYRLNLYAAPLSMLQQTDVDLFVPQRNENKNLYLYEDFWRRDNEVARERLLSHLGDVETVFARNCHVERITASEIKDFMNRYHSYGFAKAKFHYGIFDEVGDMIAAASFSAPRPMPRNVPGVEEKVVFNSYEWVRYASLPDLRVVGGMGKVLSFFENEVHPDDIMSYADLEWSSGEVYEKLGFVETGFVDPVEFLVDPVTFKRYSTKKIRKGEISEEGLSTGLMPIFNRGSRKYLKIYKGAN